MSERTWEPGELVVERHVFRGEVRFGAPMWLVADDGQSPDGPSQEVLRLNR